MSVKIAFPRADLATEATSTAEVFEKLRSVFAEQFELEGESMKSEARLVADLELDSLDFVALGTEIEVSMGVVLDENDLTGCETLGDLVDRVAARKSKLDG
jgi:acyl carrier protein